MRNAFSVNGRDYVMPGGPVVVVCVDGSEPDYHLEAMRAGRMPWLEDLLDGGGVSWPARSAMPALTNPNNVSIATGRPPAVHGITGNCWYDEQVGELVPMEDPGLLRARTIFSVAADAGLDVAVVTAKDKLRRMLGAGLGPARGVCFSAELADRATLAEHGVDDVLHLVGRPLPEVYSPGLSEFTLAAGIRLLETRPVDLMYLSLSDFVQHKHAPGTEEANAFYGMLDAHLAQLDALGATLVVTADHGMSAKSDAAGRPRIVYLDDEVHRALGTHLAEACQVVLPITDPYTVHHGALGSFATVHVADHVRKADTVANLVTALRHVAGVQAAHARDDAAARFALPADRIGDVVVLAEETTALGRNVAWHDLSGLDAPLRSHGALGEVDVPFLVNRPVSWPSSHSAEGPDALVHNYDAFWVATTVVAGTATIRPGSRLVR